jgi:hypothetical protein
MTDRDSLHKKTHFSEKTAEKSQNCKFGGLNLFQNALQYATGMTTRMANHVAMLARR